jgi:putative ABC transport system ATP-binding protein
MSALITVDRLVKRYGSGHGTVEALRDGLVRDSRGQFVSVTGPSGCGKSTLLGLLAGLNEPTSGRVVVAGQNVAALSPDARSDLRLRTIGIVFQSFNLLPTFTTLENVAVPLEFQGVPWRDAPSRAVDALACRPRARERARARAVRPLRRRAAAHGHRARARHRAAHPSRGRADRQPGFAHRQAILDLLAELNATRKLTVVMVTHSTFGATYGHRTIELADGRIVRDVTAPFRPALHLVSDADPA